HWAATRLDEVVYWGPDHVRQFCIQKDPISIEQILDDTWAEGGLILDFDEKSLLWFGGELIDNPLNTLTYLNILRTKWEGWGVSWAIEGQLDIVRYLSLPDSLIIGDGDEKTSEIGLPEVSSYDGANFLYANILASYSKSGQTLASLLFGAQYADFPIGYSDPEKITEFIIKSSYKDFPRSETESETCEPLEGGIHFDFDQHKIRIWCCSLAPGHLDQLKQDLGDWEIDVGVDYQWHKTLLPDWSWHNLDVLGAKEMENHYESREGKIEDNPALSVAKYLTETESRDVKVSSEALISRDYYSPKKMSVVNWLQQLFKGRGR
ncbi:MAG: hypothetical protein AAGK66_10795, partial [Pseudomonadota bacterium]